MELEEMQVLWSEMSDQLENQKKLTNTLIMEMTKERFKSKIGIISKYEGIGAIICFGMAILLLFQLSKLDTWYLLASGIFTIIYLIAIPIYILQSIYSMKQINLMSNTYKETLIKYAKRKKQFLFSQRVGIYLNFILVVVSLPLIIKLSSDKDIFVTHTDIWYWYIPMMTLFLIFFSKWGYRKYKNITSSATKILEELENNNEM